MKNNNKIVVLVCMTITSVVLAALLFAVAFKSLYDGVNDTGTTVTENVTESVAACAMTAVPTTDNTAEVTEAETTKNNVESGEDKSEKISVEFDGRELYAGGQAIRDDFTVSLEKADGTSEIIDNYDCPMLESDYRLSEGNNVLTFSYQGMTASVTINAINVRSKQYAPSYILNIADNDAEIEKAVKLESGLITYEEAFNGVTFSGDSQIKALATNKIFTMDKITAEIGVSYDYLDENFDSVVSKAQGKQVLVLHYGINTLNVSQSDRQKRIEQYKQLIIRLQNSLPDIRIIVSGVFPVSDTIYSDQERYAYIDDYDFGLLEMCMDLGVEYYSNNEYLEAHQEYFGSDGLHLTKEFYVNYWLKDLLITMGL